MVMEVWVFVGTVEEENVRETATRMHRISENYAASNVGKGQDPIPGW